MYCLKKKSKFFLKRFCVPKDTRILPNVHRLRKDCKIPTNFYIMCISCGRQLNYPTFSLSAGTVEYQPKKMGLHSGGSKKRKSLLKKVLDSPPQLKVLMPRKY